MKNIGRDSLLDMIEYILNVYMLCKGNKKYIGGKADRILLKSVKLDTDSEIIELIIMS